MFVHGTSRLHHRLPCISLLLRLSSQRTSSTGTGRLDTSKPCTLTCLSSSVLCCLLPTTLLLSSLSPSHFYRSSKLQAPTHQLNLVPSALCGLERVSAALLSRRLIGQNQPSIRMCCSSWWHFAIIARPSSILFWRRQNIFLHKYFCVLKIFESYAMRHDVCLLGPNGISPCLSI